MRDYVHNLNAADGVYAGVVSIGGLIRRSAVEALLATSAGAAQFDDFSPELRFDLLDPDDIADVFWDPHAKRDRPEDRRRPGVSRRRRLRRVPRTRPSGPRPPAGSG